MEGSSGFAQGRSGLAGRRSWWLVGLLVIFVYSAWTLGALRHAGPQEFIHFGRGVVGRSLASPVISGNAARFHYDGEIGFDGQFAYFLAVDPRLAHHYMDAYRYTRILYPMLARALALGDADLVPYTLIGVNLAMIALGTLVVGAWLERRGVSAWLAAVYGFYPGVFITLQRDTTEIMAYALVALAIHRYDFGTHWRVPMSAAVFALAALTRETSAIFAGLWGVSLLFSGEGPVRARMAMNSRPAAMFLGIAVVPLLAWKAILLLWLGPHKVAAYFTPIPFGGILYQGVRHQLGTAQLHTVVLPGLLCGGAALFALFRGLRRVEFWALLINVMLHIVFLGPPSFNDISSSARVTLPIVLAAVLCVPFVPPGGRAWFWASAALWLAPMVTWLMIPTARTILAASIGLRW